MKDPKEFIKKIASGEEEIAEEAREAIGAASKIATGYPKPAGRYTMIVEGFNISIEEPYFWILDYMRYMWGYPYIDKITDIFAASENSAFFGAAQQRIGLQQDKVSQFLATVGKMVKELFQLVRELRVLDERLGYYADSYTASRSSESAEITLKGIWVDLVEQGAKNPGSVYGMAREVQFTTLPDLFFSTHPKRQEDVDDVVETARSQFNRKVREVLKRKLRSFLAWKEHTYEEIKNRRKFTLKYLRQHYEIIKMYMTWVKPYLRNIQRLQMDQSKNETPDLLVAFETSMIEIEILARKPLKKVGGEQMNACILAHFLLRTKPEMSYQQEGYQRGPVHLGRIQFNLRAYGWTDKEVELYKKMRDEEDFQLLGMVDGSVKAALDALGDELSRYLEEAGEEMPKKEPIAQETKKAPFVSFFKSPASKKKASKPKAPKKTEFEMSKARADAVDKAKTSMWGIYHHFKKHHGMLNW